MQLVIIYFGFIETHHDKFRKYPIDPAVISVSEHIVTLLHILKEIYFVFQSYLRCII